MNAIIERLKKHYLPLFSLVFLAGLIFYLKWTKRDTITFITQATGYISIIIISISLAIGPVNLLLKYKNPVSTYFRRDISLTGGLLAVIHSISGLFVHLRGNNWQYFLNKTEHGYSIRLDNFGLANHTGLLSALIIILLLITSNDYFIRILNTGKWKNIQRLAYFMFILAIVHCVYYRIVKENINLIYYLYVPLFIIVFTFQMIGVWLKSTSMNKKIQLNSTITCAECGFKKEETMPVDSCQIFYECTNCGKILKPGEGDCCVYCTYGSAKCPPVQKI